MTMIISRTHRFLSRLLISRSSHLFRSHRICFNQMINSLFRLIKNQNLKLFSNSFKRDRDRSHKYFASTAYLSFVFNTTVDLAFAFASIFALVVVFKLDSVIHIAFLQFAAFRKKEINDLIEKDVFQSVNKNDVSSDVRIFNSRFVDEIKHFDTNKAFEKSRLVVQTFNDRNKNLVLTQSLTIQRVSQRLIMYLVAVLSNMNLHLRNIT